MFGPIESQTAGLPLPSGRETTICRLGNPLALNVCVPTGRPLGPGIASTTRKKPNPSGRKKTGVPSAAVPIGIVGCPSARATPRNVTVGPIVWKVGVTEGVCVMVRVGVPVRVTVVLGVGVRVNVPVAVRVGGGGPVGVRLGVSVRV